MSEEPFIRSGRFSGVKILRGVLNRLDEYRRMDQKESMRQLSRWYSSKRGARALVELNALMQQWLSQDDGTLSLEISSFLGHVNWIKEGNFRSSFRVAPLDADIRADFDFLPIETESSDLLVVCHVLEFVEDPHRFLREVERVLAPQGKCVIVAFNRFGLTGLARPFRLFRHAPWCGRFYSRRSLENWLSVLGFSIRKHAWLSSPFAVYGNRPWCNTVNFVLAKSLFWMSGFYIVYAQKQTSAMILSGKESEGRNFIRGGAVQPTAFN